MEPRRVQRIAARASLGLCALAVVYLVWRFERISLPDAACSPLWDVQPGTTLLLDAHPPVLRVGDVVVFRGPSGDLLLARVAEPPAGRRLAADELWLVTDRDDCPSPASEEWGALGRERVSGRLVLALPW